MGMFCSTQSASRNGTSLTGLVRLKVTGRNVLDFERLKIKLYYHCFIQDGKYICM